MDKSFRQTGIMKSFFRGGREPRNSLGVPSSLSTLDWHQARGSVHLSRVVPEFENREE
jgi:hypothetical protein